MTELTNLGCQAANLGLLLCSIVLCAALVERASFALLRRFVKTAANARGLFGCFSWVGGTAPMFGILGTVFGIMLAFQGATSGTGLDQGRLLQGIAIALSTTGIGLVEAIVAMTGRALFHRTTATALQRCTR